MIKDMSLNYFKLLTGLFIAGFLFSPKIKAADGKAIYKQNCAVCHALTDQKLAGPGLKGIADRAPKGDWLFNWVKNNTKMIKEGDAYANKIYKENGNAAMTVFEGVLSDDDIKAVVEYIKNPPVEQAAAQGTKSAETSAETKEQGGIQPLYLILGVVLVLAVLITILRGVKTSLQNVANKRDGKELVETQPFFEEVKQWMSNNRRLVGVFALILVFMGMRSCWNSLWTIGVYYDEETKQGYKPEQPIKFSHKIHAGENAIACQYCHNSVEKSKHAGLPTVNVCMNCHKGISTGPQYGEKEIGKIYAAAGFDLKSGTYDQSKANPIKWIKVHNLPDHVYFNHSQHVVVGKQECTTCHGEVKEMTVAEQKSPLTMGWCIDCHRKTEVAMSGNSYYDKLHAFLKEKYKKEHRKNFTVEEMGGLECGKCHY